MRRYARHRSGVSRRDVLAAGGAALAVGLLPSTPASGRAAPAGQTVLAQGSVLDGARARSDGRRGIPGVMVSNGEDVTLSDADGRWALELGAGDDVFVIKPPHWTPSPQPGCYANFSTPHRPSAFSEPHRGDIDFSLRRSVEPSRFEALLFADVQTANAEELGFARDIILRNLAGSGAAFVVNHGDVMGDDLSLFPSYREMIGETGVTWHHCPGNHDMNLDSEDPRFAFETWRREIGPTHYAFQHAQATFILLNTVDYAGAGAAFPGGRGYRGLIGERQLRFVENVLRHVADDHLVAVSMHIPLTNFENPDSAHETVADRVELMRLLARRRHTVSFAGHSHTTEHHYLGAEHGFDGPRPHHHHVLTAVSGSWWSGERDQRGIPVSNSRDGSPKGFHVLMVDGNQYATRFVPFDQPAARHMRVVLCRGDEALSPPLLASPLDSAHLADLRLLADVFDGGPRTRVTFEIEGSGLPPVEMRRTRVSDPFIVETFTREAALNKPWVRPAASSHIWTAPLNGALAGGHNRLVVRAAGEFGTVHESVLPLDVLA